MDQSFETDPLSLQNRRNFLRISGEQRRKRGERELLERGGAGRAKNLASRFARARVSRWPHVCVEHYRRGKAPLTVVPNLRKQPSFFAPGPSGVSREVLRNATRAGSEGGRLFSQTMLSPGAGSFTSIKSECPAQARI